MGNVVVVGAQWGDEGKGKIVDWLSERADVVVRFQGGHNAGHTLVIDGVAYKLSLLPSRRRAAGQARRHRQRRGARPLGAARRDRQAARRRAWRSRPDSLLIAENAPLILPLHRELDRRARRRRGAAQDRHHRARHRPGLRGQGRPARDPRRRPRATRRRSTPKLDRLLAHHNALRRGLGADADRPRRR